MKVGLVDTNILIYAAVGAETDQGKWEAAHFLLDQAPHCLSGQNLAEFVSTMIRKLKVPIAETVKWLEYFEYMEVQPVDREIVLSGVALSERFLINYWDAALIAAAQRMGVGTLYTEDLNHGQAYGGVTAVNPFLEQ